MVGHASSGIKVDGIHHYLACDKLGIPLVGRAAENYDLDAPGGLKNVSHGAGVVESFLWCASSSDPLPCADERLLKPPQA